MTTKRVYCYSCEAEFKVVYDGTEPLKTCVFCGESLEDDESDIEEQE